MTVTLPPSGRQTARTTPQATAIDSADGGVVSAEQLLERMWDEFADPFTNAVAVTVMRLRRKLGDPPLIQIVRRFHPPGTRPGLDTPMAVRFPRRRSRGPVQVLGPGRRRPLRWPADPLRRPRID
jgi:hypothetical protein